MNDFGSEQIYELELWTNTGIRVADLSPIAHLRSFTEVRNEPEEIIFDLDMFAWEDFCDGIKLDARAALEPLAMEVKLKRNGTYRFGTRIMSGVLNIGTDYTMSDGSAQYRSPAQFNPTITVTCTGYLDLFINRLVTIDYSQQDRTFIACDLITQAQAVTNGDTGVTLNPVQYLTGVPTDRSYSRQNVKTGLQDLAQLIDAPFDMKFDASKVFSTYQQVGNKRTDLKFIYGGQQSNVEGIYNERNGSSVFNEIIDIGSGFGPDQLVSTVEDNASQQTYFLSQGIKQDNSVVLQPTLDQNAATYLAQEKAVLDIPQITISGNELQGRDFLEIGDRIPLEFVGHSYLSGMDGIYRLEKMVCNIDDNGFESSIEMYFDSYMVDTNS